MDQGMTKVSLKATCLHLIFSVSLLLNLLTVNLFIVSLRDVLLLMGSLYFWELILSSHFLKLLAIPFLQPDRTGLEIGSQ